MPNYLLYASRTYKPFSAEAGKRESQTSKLLEAVNHTPFTLIPLVTLSFPRLSVLTKGQFLSLFVTHSVNRQSVIAPAANKHS